MKSTISFFVFLLLVSISPLISFATDNYIATKDLNVRTGAGTGYSVSFTLQKGDEVEVLSKDGSWYKVNYLGKIGYASSKYLEFVSATETSTSQQSNSQNSVIGIFILILIVAIAIAIAVFNYLGPTFNSSGPPARFMSRREYYNEVYLKSDDWKRKRFVVLRRDNWKCVYCGSKATQVHHKRYAKYNIGKEPIEWLVSVCESCHDAQHH